MMLKMGTVPSQNPFHSQPSWIMENRATDEVIDLTEDDDDVVMTCSGFPSTSSPNLQNRSFVSHFFGGDILHCEIYIYI